MAYIVLEELHEICITSKSIEIYDIPKRGKNIADALVVNFPSKHRKLLCILTLDWSPFVILHNFQILWSFTGRLPTLKQHGHFSNVFLISFVSHYNYDMHVSNQSASTHIWSALLILIAWYFSTRTEVATVSVIHPFIISCLWVNILQCYNCCQPTIFPSDAPWLVGRCAARQSEATSENSCHLKTKITLITTKQDIKSGIFL